MARREERMAGLLKRWRASGQSPAAFCRRLRQQRSRPVLSELDELRRKLQADVLPKSPLGDALRYLDNQWAPLQRFLDDGRLAIDNNPAAHLWFAGCRAPVPLRMDRSSFLATARSSAPSRAGR
jgi:hypothetical protein